MRVYAIGDVHGHLAELERVHALVAKDRARTGDDMAPVVHLGDLVDRGPDAKGVLDFLIAGRDAGAPWITIRGNHDDMFLRALTDTGDAEDDLDEAEMWLAGRLGAEATLRSYGVRTGRLFGHKAIRRDAMAAIPAAHRQFLAALPYFHATPEILFVHAGILPGVPITRQDPEDLMWIREPFLYDARDHGPLVVHGHTPVDRPEHAGNRVNLDTGAGFGEPLTAAVFEGRSCWILTEDGRVPLDPA